jgi:eukaryotic-like serine/threonine-protein kinase
VGDRTARARRDAAAPLTAPDVLDGRFELQNPLGSGGMAAVYRAWDRQGRRSCAVKVLADVLAGDDEFRRRFRHEAASAGGLTHPRIVTVYGWGQDGLRQFIAMEYVGGGTLRERLQRDGRLPEADALRIAAEVADAIAYAHGRHVVHRDIKPHNILLTEDGHVKVADFGIAVTLGATSFTRTGTVMGSAPYLSPEQARGDAAGPASDQYALGIVLYEMLAGRVPFVGEAPISVALKHLHEAPPNLRDLRPDVSPATAALVDRLLAKSPDDRYPDAAALAADLHRLTGALPPRGADPAPRAARKNGAGWGRASRPVDATVPIAAPQAAEGATAALGGLDAAIGATAQIAVDAASGTRKLPAGASYDNDPLSKTSSLAAVASPPPDAVSGTAKLRLPGQRRPRVVAARAAVAAVCVALGLSILAAAYRTAWMAAHVTTPNLIGRTVADAAQSVQALRLGLNVSAKRQDSKAPFGVVIAQDPPPGAGVAKGTVVNLIVSEGSGVVPDIMGQTIQQASGMLERVGLRLGKVAYTFDDQVASGRIIYQFQSAGTRLGSSGGVDVLVSQGAPLFQIGPGPGPGRPEPKGNDHKD